MMDSLIFEFSLLTPVPRTDLLLLLFLNVLLGPWLIVFDLFLGLEVSFSEVGWFFLCFDDGDSWVEHCAIVIFCPFFDAFVSNC